VARFTARGRGSGAARLNERAKHEKDDCDHDPRDLGFLMGCAPSLHPLYTEQDLIFDPLLIGEWRGKDNTDKSKWTFTEGDGKNYMLRIVDHEGKKAPLNSSAEGFAGIPHQA
jgi:hypothetical protein